MKYYIISEKDIPQIIDDSKKPHKMGCEVHRGIPYTYPCSCGANAWNSDLDSCCQVILDNSKVVDEEEITSIIAEGMKTKPAGTISHAICNFIKEKE
jgi:hypothetical protein